MSVRVVHGAIDGRWEMVGKTLREVRGLLNDIYNLHPALIAWVNGIRCDDATVLQEGDNLEFGRVSGEKGGVQDFWTESEVRQLYGDDGFRRMTEVGLTPAMQLVFTGHEVAAFGRSLGSNESTLTPIPISVDVEAETLEYKGQSYHCERTEALVLKSLIRAGGEIRSTSDIKREFPEEIWEERLDLTIKRKLIPHVSGVGRLIESVSKRGYRLRVEPTE